MSAGLLPSCDASLSPGPRISSPGQMEWVAVCRVRLVLANVDGQIDAIRDVLWA
jgi:hypothetical protein